MSRLTEKNKFDIHYSISISKNLLQSAYDKLGKLEDLEEEIGCPLEVVFKALEIIKEKPQAELSLIQLGKIKTYEEYLNYTNYWELDLYGDMVYTEEEFNLLKGILNDEQ